MPSTATGSGSAGNTPDRVGGERVRDDRPRNAMVPGRGLHDRAAAVGDRRPDRLARPGGKPGTGGTWQPAR
jgi:hypothetical protein